MLGEAEQATSVMVLLWRTECHAIAGDLLTIIAGKGAVLTLIDVDAVLSLSVQGILSDDESLTEGSEEEFGMNN